MKSPRSIDDHSAYLKERDMASIIDHHEMEFDDDDDNVVVQNSMRSDGSAMSFLPDQRKNKTVTKNDEQILTALNIKDD